MTERSNVYLAGSIYTMKPARVYLAGAIEGAAPGDWGATWRQLVTPKFEEKDWGVYDPVAYEELRPYTTREEYLEARATVRDEGPFMDVTRRFINADLNNVRKSDLVMFYHDGTHSNGSAGEVTYAYSLGVPVFTLLHEDIPVAKFSSWLVGCSSLIMTGGLSRFLAEFDTLSWYLEKRYPRFQVV